MDAEEGRQQFLHASPSAYHPVWAALWKVGFVYFVESRVSVMGRAGCRVRTEEEVGEMMGQNLYLVFVCVRKCQNSGIMDSFDIPSSIHSFLFIYLFIFPLMIFVRFMMMCECPGHVCFNASSVLWLVSLTLISIYLESPVSIFLSPQYSGFFVSFTLFFFHVFYLHFEICMKNLDWKSPKDFPYSRVIVQLFHGSLVIFFYK